MPVRDVTATLRRPAGSEPANRRLVRRLLPDARRVTRLGPGFSNDVYLVSTDYGSTVLRLVASEASWLAEQRAYTMLRGTGVTPILVAAGRVADRHWLQLSYVAGRTLEAGGSTRSRQLFTRAGEILARIHAMRCRAYGTLNTPAEGTAGTWQELVWRRLLKYLDRGRRCSAIAAAEARRVRRVARRLVDRAVPDGPCLVHGDFRPGNLIVGRAAPASAGQPLYAIDFEHAEAGEPVLDIARMYDCLARHGLALKAFVSGYASVRTLPDLDAALPLARLTNYLGGLNWSLKRDDASFAARNLAAMRTLL